MKSSIQQIRGQCANDIRKRDIDVQKLKARLAERQRGKRDGLGVATISIVPPPKSVSLNSKSMQGGEDLNAPGYSLQQETTEFLTQLCQNLSDENDSLIRLSQDSIQTLKELQGLTDSQPDESCMQLSVSEAEMNTLPGPLPPYETISVQMSLVLNQLRTLLTNPSFVPLEEVEMRDNEILSLRDGWEKMEARWQEAVSMMDGWHRRMAGGGDSVNIDELVAGIALRKNIDENNASVDQDDNMSDLSSSGDNPTSAKEVPSPTSRNSSRQTSDRTTRSSAKAPKRLDTVLEERSGNEQPKKSPQRPLRDDQCLARRSNDGENNDDTPAADTKNMISPRRKHRGRQVESRIPKQVSSDSYNYYYE